MIRKFLGHPVVHSLRGLNPQTLPHGSFLKPNLLDDLQKNSMLNISLGLYCNRNSKINSETTEMRPPASKALFVRMAKAVCRRNSTSNLLVQKEEWGINKTGKIIVVTVIRNKNS